MARRTVGPLSDRIAAVGLDRAELRAEIAVAALTGIALARAAGTLAVLGTASTPDVSEITEPLLRDVAE